MGSTGSGRFSDYSNNSPNNQSKKGKGTGIGGSAQTPASPAGGGELNCEQSIEEMILEDVASLDYFKKHSDVPSPGSSVKLATSLLDTRLFIETESGEALGLVPTQFNWLRRCMKKFSYSGSVSTSRVKPLPDIVVSLTGSSK